jgi:diacylglycerol kinase
MAKIKRLANSFKYAMRGLKKVFKEEQNFRIHVFFTLVVLLLSFYFQIKLWEFVIIILLIALVLALEIINSIIERLTDMLKPRIHQYVKDMKDMGAALVFIGAITALIVGILIFFPYIVALF